MQFNIHSHLWNKHAFLSASKYHWVNYSPEQLIKRYEAVAAAAKGTEIHAHAAWLIENRHKMANHKKALNMFVNDAIGFRMSPELVLYYSDNCFGTADALSYTEVPDGKDILRIHDLKTGTTPVKMTQLEVYAAMFCLEYGKIPSELEIYCAIYQGNAVIPHIPDPQVIVDIMVTIVDHDKTLNEYMAGDMM